MKKMLVALLVLFTELAFAAPSAPPVIDIVHAEFGLFEAASDSRAAAFVPTSVVPLRVGQRYGWMIEVGKAPRTLSVREEYLLPVVAPNADDPLNASLGIVLQRRNQISQRQLVPVNGKIYGEWSVGAREPAGHRHLEVIIEGRSAANFEFDVKLPADLQ